MHLDNSHLLGVVNNYGRGEGWGGLTHKLTPPKLPPNQKIKQRRKEKDSQTLKDCHPPPTTCSQMNKK